MKDDVAACLENEPEAFEDVSRQAGEVGTTVIDGRLRDRAQHALRHVCRSGDLQEMAASTRGH
jgi:hypothetical protein